MRQTRSARRKRRPHCLGAAADCGRRNVAEWTFSGLERVLGSGLRSRGSGAQRVIEHRRTVRAIATALEPIGSII